MERQTLYVRLTAASPVHVGCGEVYEPTNFYIDDETAELVHFDTAVFLGQLSEHELDKLSAICRQGDLASIVQMMQFFRRNAADLRLDGERVPVAPGLIGHYKQALGISLNDRRRLANEINRFQIMRTAFDPLTGEAYIPGSAVKGAIRTAVLNLRNGGAGSPRFNDALKLQERLLEYDFRHLESDPFRMIKVSDFFPVGEVRRRICYAVDKKKKPGKFEARAPYQIVEIIEPGAVFAGTVTVLMPPKGAEIRHPVEAGEIEEALRHFYTAELRREARELGVIAVPAARPSGLPLRIGRHSGAESVTVEGHRSIKILQGKGNSPKFLDHATTVWLTAETSKGGSKLQPFAWMGWERLEQAAWRQIQEQMRRERAEKQRARTAEAQALHASLEERLVAEREQARLREEARRETEERARRKAEEMKRREAELAAMSEEDRLVRMVEEAPADQESEQLVNTECYPKLAQLEGEAQRRLAEALKAFYSRCDKWKVKKKNKKQYEKVQNIKKVLGESS